MTTPCGLDPLIEIRLGHRQRVVTPQDLAARLGVALPELRGVLLGFLLRPSPDAAAASACPTVSVTPALSAVEGEQEGEVGNDETRTKPEYLKTRTSNETNESREELGSKEVPRDPRVATIANYLAQVLHDPEGLPTYERLANQYPAEHLKHVLALVLRVPAERIRQSRGAYFTALVGRLRSGSHPYA